MSEQSSCSFFRGIRDAIPSKLVIPLFVLVGVAAGLGLYSMYASRIFSYLANDSSQCVNCHIMAPAYASWSKSSHGNWTTCKDCHVPQSSALAGMLFEARDGLHHASVLLTNSQPAAPRPREAATKVIQENCVRCHTQLTTEFVQAGKATFDDIKHGRQKACWDCHRHVPHTKNSGLASAPGALAPFPPASPVPDWLKNILR
ncbi:MAG: cytochrome c nitrite reductase small subunit [Azoarcus sp.]|jgi:cytochrome c nitrite reductase small subunit|nr:cytochrome c nitrite reductase small subunit [Azoarcus sp.]